MASPAKTEAGLILLGGVAKMAKAKTIVQVYLVCSECRTRNYYKKKNRQFKKKLELRKYCPVCNKHTLHVEGK
ncbi:MAG: 50S ribosomal protein L33 [Thermotogae bacterium]|nr:MAG: 50S ribosomal protein L33 [Thermotogota bacterium]